MFSFWLYLKLMYQIEYKIKIISMCLVNNLLEGQMNGFYVSFSIFDRKLPSEYFMRNCQEIQFLVSWAKLST